MRRVLALSLLLWALAGCSEPAPAADEGEDATTDPTADEGTNLTVPVQPEPMPPREVFNESFDFPQLSADAAISDSFDVAEGDDIRFSMASTAECPVYWGTEEPAIVFTSPSGREVALIDFGGSSGDTWSGLCSGAAPEYLGVDVQDTYSETGEWQVGSRGQFRGSVEIVVVVDPAT